MKSKTIITVLLVFLISGCATQNKINYYWGNYSATLYALKTAPSPEVEQKHIEELEKIVRESTDKGYRVPPGVQAELGYRYARQGKNDLASSHFQTELTTYPESRLFVEKLMGMLKE